MLREHIKSSGESQTVWADRLGIARSYLSDLLNGNKVPSLDLAVRIQRATKGAVPADSWIALPEQPAPASEAPEEDAA
ncbi:Cro-like protein [Nostoc phage Nsp-JY21]